MIGEEYLFKRSDGEIVHGLRWSNHTATAVVVIITGMEEHASRYEPFAKFLVEQGYEIYCLDLLGQGANITDEKKRGVWPLNGFEMNVDTVAELILRVKKDRPVYLFGHSLGASLAQRTIQKYGHLITKVIICAPSDPDLLSKVGFFLALLIVNKNNQHKKSKFFNNLLFGGFAKAIPNARTPFDWLSHNEDNVDRYIADPYCGYGSTGSFYREIARGVHKLIDKKQMARVPKSLKMLMLGGAEDPVSKCGLAIHRLEGIYRRLQIADLRTIIYPKMRHEILNETEHEKVYSDIAHFLKS